MSLDLLPFTDAIVSTLESSFTLGGIGATIAREYEVEYDLGTVEGLHVNVFPAMYGITERATRSEDYLDVMTAIVVLQRYTQPDKPPKSWLDERVEWVENLVFSPLVKIECPLLLDAFWESSVKVVTVYDWTFLRQQKVFWSEVEVSFRRIRTRT